MSNDSGISPEELYEKTKEFNEKRSNIDTAKATEREAYFDNMWKQEAMKYEQLSKQMDKNRVKLVAATRSFYNAIKKNLTDNGKVDIAMRRTGKYAGYHYCSFPHQLKENAMALAWIDRLGNNEEEMYKLFPNIVYREVYPRKVMREPYSKIDGTKLLEKCNIVPVLTAIRFALFSNTEIIEAKHSKSLINKREQLFIHTPYYYIDIVFSGNLDKPYDLIITEPAHYDVTWQST